MRVPPAVQAMRDRERVSILESEVQQNPNDPNLRAELSRAALKNPFLDRIDTAIREAEKPGSTGLVNLIPGMPKVAEVAPQKTPGLTDRLLGTGEAALSVGTGMAANFAGNAAGFFKGLTSGKLGTPEGMRMAEDRAREVTDSLTYQPRTDSGKDALGAFSGALDASKIQGMGPAEAVPLASIMAGPGKIMRPGAKPVETPSFGSAGAAGVAPEHMARAAVANATPELQQVVDRAIKTKQPINHQTLTRHVEADSLPVPINLTKGQATQDVSLLSSEQNLRGKHKVLADRFNEQNKQLIENTNAIREQAAPDVFATTKPEHGEMLIDAYRAKDAALNKDISARYQALKDANGGNFPLDASAFVSAADEALHKQLLFDHVPAEYRSVLNRLKEGGSMTFENFEALRTNLARTMRSAADGNTRAAAGVIRQALEELPMPQGAENLKPLADAARNAARGRFSLIEKDPAYKAVVTGRASADKFIDKYVVGTDLKNLQAMKEILADDQVAQQTIASGVVNHLKDRAGVIANEGNFSQAGYNKALEGVRPKLGVIFEPKQRQQLETLGNVSRYTQQQPRGSFVNNSNTATALMSESAKSAAEGAANVAAKGVPIGTWTRKVMGNRAQQKELARTLQSGAGILLKDVK